MHMDWFMPHSPIQSRTSRSILSQGLFTPLLKSGQRNTEVETHQIGWKAFKGKAIVPPPYCGVCNHSAAGCPWSDDALDTRETACHGRSLTQGPGRTSPLESEMTGLCTQASFAIGATQAAGLARAPTAEGPELFRGKHGSCPVFSLQDSPANLISTASLQHTAVPLFPVSLLASILRSTVPL